MGIIMNIKTYAKRALLLYIMALPTFFYCAAPAGKPPVINLGSLSLEQVEQTLEKERKNYDAFLQKKTLKNESLKSIIDRRDQLLSDEIQANKELTALHEQHPLKHLSEEKLKKLQSIELTGDTPEDEEDRRALKLLKEQSAKEVAIAHKKLAAQLNLRKISPAACDDLLERDDYIVKILKFETQYFKFKYEPLVSTEQYARDKKSLDAVLRNDQLAREWENLYLHNWNLLKDFDNYSNFPKKSEHYTKRYPLCWLALERNRILKNLFEIQKKYWQEKYFDVTQELDSNEQFILSQEL